MDQDYLQKPTQASPLGSTLRSLFRSSEERRPNITLVSKELISASQSISITYICATKISTRLRRIPVGFYISLKSEDWTQRTSNKPALVRRDDAEWNDEIILPSDLPSTISLILVASFELGPTLGDGEVLRMFEFTVSELLDLSGDSGSIALSGQGDGVIELEIRQISGQSVYEGISKPITPEGTLRVEELTNMGHSALIRYRGLQEQRDLDQSIRHFEEARDLCPLVHPSHATVLFNLANARLMCCRVNGQSTDLDASIDLYRTVLRLRLPGHPDRPLTLLSLGIALKARFQRQNDEEDEAEGDRLLCQVLDVSVPDSYAYHAAALALCGTADAEMVPGLEVPWRNNPDDDDGIENEDNYSYNGNEGDSDDDSSEGDDEDGNLDRMDATLHWFYHPDPSHGVLDHLGVLWCIPLSWIGYNTDPGKAIVLLEAVAQYTSDDHPYKPKRLNNLGLALSTRYAHSGNLADLAKLIPIFENAVRLTPDGHPQKPRRLNNLALSLLTRYECFGDAAELEKSILILEDALRLTPDSHPAKSMRLSNLGNSLLTRYEYTGDTMNLEKSVSIGEEALRLTSNGHPAKPTRLSNLSNSLSARYQASGDVVDLERSISLREDAVRLTPESHAAKPLLLSNLGTSLSARFEHSGDMADLEKSIFIFEDAVRLTQVGRPALASRLNNLGLSLSVRYDHFGDTVDLERSISIGEDVVRLTPDDHPDKPGRLNNLGSSLSSRYEHFGGAIDLERSISLREDAVRLTPDGHPSKPMYLSNIAFSLSARYEDFGDIVDIEKSISFGEDALRLAPDAHINYPGWLGNLGFSLLTRYKHSRDLLDLEKSITMFEDAVRLTPDGHADKPIRLQNLAHPLLQRFQLSSESSSSDLHRAILYSSEAVHSLTTPASERFHASHFWIKCLRVQSYNPQLLFDAYSAVIAILPHLAWLGLSFKDRYHQLLLAAGVVSDATSVALDLHKFEIAVEWLEQGRSIMWSQVSQLRTPVDDLRSAHPGLATQFERVSRELEHSGVRRKNEIDRYATHGSSNGIDGFLERQAYKHHTLARLRETLLAEIRALPGFERFFLPKTVDQLSSLVRSGHVVLLNASEQRCDALVIPAASKKVLHVPLSHTSYAKIAGMRRQLSGMLRHHGRVILRDGIDREGDARPVHLGPNDVFGSILSRLWSDVVSPILAILDLSTSPAELPRIFWCPTGPFTLLPIHAAGLYDATNPGPKLSDFVVSSYIPTMSTLQQPLQLNPQTTRSSSTIRMLAVPQPSTDGALPLNGVKEEMELIRELTSSSPFVDLQETDGTVEDVLAKMKDSDWIHFCCHGTQDQSNPLDSGLLLADGKRFNLSDIVQLSRPRGGVAFLSACQTAMGDEHLADEVIHLAAGMLLAGYSGVIATMWSIMDSDAPRVTIDVYRSLFGDGKFPESRYAAEALHRAIEELRDSGAPFLSWVPFVHYGS